MLRPALLDDGEHHGKGREAEQDQRFAHIPQQQIGCAARQQQRQHRLPKNLEGDARHGPASTARQRVGALDLEPAPRFGSAQP